MNSFHTLEDVSRGSETQLQVGAKLNYLILRFRRMNAPRDVF